MQNQPTNQPGYSICAAWTGPGEMKFPIHFFRFHTTMMQKKNHSKTHKQPGDWIEVTRHHFRIFKNSVRKFVPLFFTSLIWNDLKIDTFVLQTPTSFNIKCKISRRKTTRRISTNFYWRWKMCIFPCILFKALSSHQKSRTTGRGWYN